MDFSARRGNHGPKLGSRTGGHSRGDRPLRRKTKTAPEETAIANLES